MKKILVIIVCIIQASLLMAIDDPIFDLEFAKKMQVGIAMNAKGEKPVIKASMKGKVVSVNNNPDNSTNLGKYIIIEHKVVDVTFYSLYAMLGEILVEEDFNVNPGAPIGYAGPTGLIQDIEKGANLLFGFFSEEKNDALSKVWGTPINAYDKYWYNPNLVLKNAIE